MRRCCSVSDGNPHPNLLPRGGRRDKECSQSYFHMSGPHCRHSVAHHERSLESPFALSSPDAASGARIEGGLWQGDSPHATLLGQSPFCQCCSCSSAGPGPRFSLWRRQSWLGADAASDRRLREPDLHGPLDLGVSASHNVDRRDERPLERPRALSVTLKCFSVLEMRRGSRLDQQPGREYARGASRQSSLFQDRDRAVNDPLLAFRPNAACAT